MASSSSSSQISSPPAKRIAISLTFKMRVKNASSPPGLVKANGADDDDDDPGGGPSGL